MCPGIEKTSHPLVKMSGIRKGCNKMKNDRPLPRGRNSQFHGVVNHNDGKNQSEGGLPGTPPRAEDDKHQQTGQNAGLQAGQSSSLGGHRQVEVTLGNRINRYLEDLHQGPTGNDYQPNRPIE